MKRIFDAKIDDFVRIEGDLIKIDTDDLRDLAMMYNTLDCEISKDIIKLIKVGDYTKGYKVEKIENGYIYAGYCEGCGLYMLVTNNPKEIIPIITKEEFSRIGFIRI